MVLQVAANIWSWLKCQAYLWGKVLSLEWLSKLWMLLSIFVECFPCFSGWATYPRYICKRCVHSKDPIIVWEAIGTLFMHYVSPCMALLLPKARSCASDSYIFYKFSYNVLLCHILCPSLQKSKMCVGFVHIAKARIRWSYSVHNTCTLHFLNTLHVALASFTSVCLAVRMPWLCHVKNWSMLGVALM